MSDAKARTWFQQVVDVHERPLVRYAQRITGDVEQARDVVQATFLKLCRQDRAEVEGHLAQWLFTVCRNQAVDVRRKESRMNSISDGEAALCTSREQSPGAEYETREEHDRVLEAMGTLPANQQEVLRLKFQNGFTYRQIASITELSVSNVGYLIHTGLKTLRTRLAGQAWALEGGT